jgi:methionyl-tRNA formyltransferase
MQGKELRIVFMGTPDFAVASLKALVDGGYNIVGVITAPDKAAGRGKKINESAVKKYSVENGLNVLQPEKLKNSDFIEELKALKADLQVVVAFRMLPALVWQMPPMGTFNLHGSLLPQYRGAAPLNWAVINGETKTGVTTFLLDQKIDTGKILFKKEIDIWENDTVGTIHDSLMGTGAKLVVETVDALAEGNYKAVAQSEIMDEAEIKHAPKIFKEDCKVDWSHDVEFVRNLIRGLSPYPTAWSTLVHKDSGKEIATKLFFAMHVEDKLDVELGTIESDGKTFIKVACGNGWLQLMDLQIAGKKRMKITDFLRGFQQICEYKFQ